MSDEICAVAGIPLWAGNFVVVAWSQQSPVTCHAFADVDGSLATFLQRAMWISDDLDS